MSSRALRHLQVHGDQVFVICQSCGHFAVYWIAAFAEVHGGWDAEVEALQRRFRCDTCGKRNAKLTMDRPKTGTRLCPQCGNPLWNTGDGIKPIYGVRGGVQAVRETHPPGTPLIVVGRADGGRVSWGAHTGITRLCVSIVQRDAGVQRRARGIERVPLRRSYTVANNRRSAAISKLSAATLTTTRTNRARKRVSRCSCLARATNLSTSMRSALQNR